jgi:FtsH-binding integral membrane protein
MGGNAGVTIKSDPYLAQMYWMFAGALIAAAGLVNLKEFLEFKLRFARFSAILFLFLLTTRILVGVECAMSPRPPQIRLGPRISFRELLQLSLPSLENSATIRYH